MSLVELLPRLRESDVIFLDTETSSLFPWSKGKVLAGLAIKPIDGEGEYLAFRHPGSVRSFIELKLVVDAIRGKTLVMHNAKYDMAVLYQEGFDLSNECVLDTAVLARLVVEDELTYELKRLGAKFVDSAAGDDQKALKAYMRKNKLKLYSEVPEEIMEPYAIQDVVLTEGLYKRFMPDITRRNLTELLELEVALTRALFGMERHGMRVDIEHVITESAHLHETVNHLEETAYQYAGREFNLASTAAIGGVMGSLDIKSSIKTPKGKPSWNVKAFALIDHPLAETIRMWRTASKLLASYYDNFIELRDENDVLHPNFNQSGAKTGRLSCREPNLQNIPKLGGHTAAVVARDAIAMSELGKESIDFDDEMAEADVYEKDDTYESVRKVRASFIPRPGFFFMFSDWSQIELRVLAEYAKEPEMLAAFKYGLDIHGLTAATAFRNLPAKGTKEYEEYRGYAKQLNFGLVYGMGIKLLAAKLGKSRDDATAFMDAYFRRFRRVRAFSDLVSSTVEDRGFLKNKWGRRRYLKPDFSYTGVNFLVQGTAADMMKDVIVRLDNALASYESRLLATIHDEVIVEVRYGEEEKVLTALIDTMTRSPKFDTKLSVDVVWSPTSWGDKMKLSCKECDGRGFKFINTTAEKLEKALFDGLITKVGEIITEECTHCDGYGHTLEGMREWQTTSQT